MSTVNGTAGATTRYLKGNRSRLQEHTLRLLRERLMVGRRAAALQIIAEDANLTFHWLDHFSRGTDTSPSVDKVERLYEYLAGKPVI